ncbi:MAG: hypothetical protein MJ003_06745 [Paludibacteraceae bacterium]|nr:hypothetical protein [Paludibacteraceae bacterium]
MKAIDIVILLKKISLSQQDISMRLIADSLQISVSSVSESLERSKTAHMIDLNKKNVNTLALKEFLLHGIMYVFPVQIGRIKRGIPTYISAPPIDKYLASNNEVFVWPTSKGTARGQSIKPLYDIIPNVAIEDETFYKLLVIVDTLRIGGVREREIANKELDIIFSQYEKDKH